jgi:hypothetical protein
VIYAFADPIPPGKTDDVRRFYAELCGARKADYDEIARRSRVMEELYWLQPESAGDLVVVASASDQQAFDAILADPQSDFERWLREQIEGIFGFDPSLRQGIRNELLGTLRV